MQTATYTATVSLTGRLVSEGGTIRVTAADGRWFAASFSGTTSAFCERAAAALDATRFSDRRAIRDAVGAAYQAAASAFRAPLAA